MYAVVVTGGKQYRVSEGDTIEVERLSAQVGEKVELPVVLKVDGENVDNAEGKVTAEVVRHGRNKKIIVFKYKPKKNQRRKQGHRQPFTVLKILSL